MIDAIRAPLGTQMWDADGSMNRSWQRWHQAVDFALGGDLLRFRQTATATTVGAAGTAASLPAQPTGYLQVNIGGTTFQIPYYAKA